MLFNSPLYILLFLPVTCAVYFALCRRRFGLAGTAWLVLASLFFYSYWNPAYLSLILASLLMNYALGTVLRSEFRSRARRREGAWMPHWVLLFGVAGNLALLGYFKYTDFFLHNANALLGWSVQLPHLLLPLGISFFTFQQIAYLVDSSRREASEQNFLNYCLFVCFFPQLIAGPIVHHQEMMPQFQRLRNQLPDPNNLALGLFFFSVGLFKKVWIADRLSAWANLGFNAEAPLRFFDAWGTSISYTLQLYFDFSGYCDMAIGAALFFNIRLPVNFNSPYRAASIREFWRCWHMTLSRWLRDYLYIPLGGNRLGLVRGCGNLWLTFLLGGLWHGAGWTFILWGALHGCALVLQRLWERTGLRLPRAVGWLLTLLFVNAAWVIFRAPSLNEAGRVFQGMLGICGMDSLSWFSHHLLHWHSLQKLLPASSGTPLLLPWDAWWYLLCFLGIVLFLPNSCAMGGFLPHCASEHEKRPATWRERLRYRPTLAWAGLTVVLACAAMHRLLAVAPSEFLYFNF